MRLIDEFAIQGENLEGWKKWTMAALMLISPCIWFSAVLILLGAGAENNNKARDDEQENQ
jgi:hypothetical protein